MVRAAAAAETEVWAAAEVWAAVGVWAAVDNLVARKPRVTVSSLSGASLSVVQLVCLCSEQPTLPRQTSQTTLPRHTSPTTCERERAMSPPASCGFAQLG